MDETRKLPLTADDLEAIARAVREVTPMLLEEPNGYGDPVYTPLGSITTRIEINLPANGPIVGDLVLHDGWVGFEPKGWNR